jgi:hypothetical protein
MFGHVSHPFVLPKIMILNSVPRARCAVKICGFATLLSALILCGSATAQQIDSSTSSLPNTEQRETSEEDKGSLVSLDSVAEIIIVGMMLNFGFAVLSKFSSGRNESP